MIFKVHAVVQKFKRLPFWKVPIWHFENYFCELFLPIIFFRSNMKVLFNDLGHIGFVHQPNPFQNYYFLRSKFGTYSVSCI